MGSFKSTVILVLVLQSVIHGEICSPGERIINTNRHSTAECSYSNIRRSLSQQTIELEVDEDVGTLKVNFPVDNFHFHLYTISLYVEKREDCQRFNRLQCLSANLHSVRTFSVSRCKDEYMNADKQIIGSVTFSNIFSGCYIAKIENRLMENKYSKTMALKTKRKDIRLQEIRPAVGTADSRTQDFNGTRNITAHIKDFAILLSERIPVHMTLVQNKSCDDYDEQNVIARFSLGLMENDALKCTQQMNHSSLQNCEVFQETATVGCTFTELAPGNYCLKIDPDDPDRCHKLSLYQGYEGCALKHTFVVEDKLQIKEPSEHVVEVNGGGWTITVAVILLVIGIVVTVIVIFKVEDWKKETYNFITGSDHNKIVDTSASPPEILLLYAQDNEDFMSLMETFREILSSVSNCKVYDCFHCDCPELAASPGEWIQCLASNPEVMVILVSSPCAVLHQEAMTHQVSVKYFQPMPYSHLFPLALHEVKFNRKKTYKNTFITRFDGTDLKSIMPFTRYCLPRHLFKLLADMQIRTMDKNIQEIPLVKRLAELQVKLKEYYIQYPDYITHLMFSVKDSMS